VEVDPDLVEWDYGRFEGQLTRQILKERPGWEMFRDGCPDGESPQDVAARADRFIDRVRGIGGDVLAFSSAHIIRMIAARWLGLPPRAGRFFFCRPASVGVLGFDHHRRSAPMGRRSSCRCISTYLRRRFRHHKWGRVPWSPGPLMASRRSRALGAAPVRSGAAHHLARLEHLLDQL
jgi:broad specificity phosphatase PhoE